MATTVAKIRIVRCPKCLKLLPEMPDVPMYQCGGCGAILKAKYHDSSNQNVSLIPETDVSQNLSLNDSSNAEIGESSNAGEIDISSETKSEESLKEEEAKPQNLKEKGHDISEERPDQSRGASSSDLSQNVESSNLRTPAVSLSGDGIRDKYRNLSRRTVRDRSFSGSFGTKSKEGAGLEDGGTSLDSDAFYSIRSWVESDKDNGSRRSAFFEDPTKNQTGSSSKFKNREILKLVEELTDQLGRSYELTKKSYPCSRNKARSSKSYTRPASGGAPFVICRKCFEVLHLPADFLISRSRSSKLKCGSCSEVMVLSFPALTCNEATEGQDSFSEEYGISFADTSSTGTEAVLNVSKVSSEMGIEEKTSAGRLHQLMGYSSARVLLFENSKSLK